MIATVAAGTAAGTIGRFALAGAQLRIGQSLPLTGPLAPVVVPIAEGQKALLDEVNAQGGVHGVPVELVTLDDAAQPDRTLANTKRLIDEERVSSLFGFAFVPGLLRAMPLINERRVPLVGVYNGADIVRSPANPYLFTTTASLGDEIATMVRTLATLGSKKLAVVYQNNELGRFMLPLVEALARRHDATLVARQPAEPDGSNGAAAAKAVADAAPQAILLLAAGAALLGFLKNLAPSSHVPIYALSLAGTTSLLEKIGPAARGMAFTQVVPYPTRQTSPLTRRFAEAMQKANLAPTYDRMWGYLNASILVEVLQRAGKVTTPAGVLAALDRMADVDVGGYRLRWGPNHRDGSSFVEITIVDHNGHFVR